MFDPHNQAQADEAQQAHFEMSLDVARHRVVRFLDDLDKDQLSALQGMIEAIQQAGTHAAVMAAFYSGFISAQIQSRFGVCQACGKDHHAELLPDSPPLP